MFGQPVGRIKEPFEQWPFLEALQDVGGGAQVAEWGVLALNNPMLRDSQKIRCRPPGIFRRRAQSGEMSGVYDCVFMIPPDTAEADSVHFDYNRPQDR